MMEGTSATFPKSGTDTSVLRRRSSTPLAEEYGLPKSVAEPTLMAYRAAGIGVWGACVRFVGVPLERIAIIMNSSQVSGGNQFGQAIGLTFKEGPLSPYRVVRGTSLIAWFLQYSIMGAAFQFFDHALSRMLNVDPVVYGAELQTPPSKEPMSSGDFTKSACKAVAAPMLTAMLESFVSNRAEVQRYFGPEKLAKIESKLNWSRIARQLGPGFVPNMMRNTIVNSSSFVLAPIVYKHLPQACHHA